MTTHKTISMRLKIDLINQLNKRLSLTKQTTSEYIRGLIERDLNPKDIKMEDHPLTKYFGKYKETPEILEFEQSLRDQRKQSWERPIEL